MLFNSPNFIYVFFPVTFVLFFLIATRSKTYAGLFLALASLVFYAQWDIKAVPLLLGSVGFNYYFGQKLAARSQSPQNLGRHALAFAVAANLMLIAIFKYGNFSIANGNAVLDLFGIRPFPNLPISLPIGISFFTFTQIAFLVDCWQGKVKERNFPHYLLFVTYFPHLIAGPVLHHSQMMPQFGRPKVYRPRLDNIAVGMAIFIVGLAKKLLLADALAPYADLVFNAASHGETPHQVTAWFGVFAYTFQIYFDFSGYSDMAIGLSLFFGIHLPVNFNSPYKASSIIDFWRRWHISLSTFLRDYLYIPLGGNRLGESRRYLNLMATMALGGLWHGASWTFVLWGMAHGLLLALNHLWSAWLGERRSLLPAGLLSTAFGWLVTFVSVCLTWVLFRADSLATAGRIYAGLFAGDRAIEPDRMHVIPFLILGFVIVLALPNAQQANAFRLLKSEALNGVALMQPLTYPLAAIAACAILYLACLLRLDHTSPFLYFQF